MTPSRHEGPPAEAHSSGRLRLQIISERTEFDDLEQHWNSLFHRCSGSPQVFQTFNWAWHWANIFHDEKTGLAIVAGWEDDRLVMLWPLAAKRSGLLKRLTWLGEPVSQYGDILVEQRDDTWRLIGLGWNYVRSLGFDIATLRKVRADALVAPLMVDVRAAIVAREFAPYLDFHGAADYAAYEQRHKSRSIAKRRQNMRRLSQRFENAQINQHQPGADAQAVVREAIRQKRAWLREFSLTSAEFADQRFEKFFIATARGDRSPGTSVMSLTCGEAVVATMIAFGAGASRGQHINSYELEYSKYSVGKLLQEACNRQAFEDGYKVYDLLTPRADYKTYWADAATEVLDFAVPLSATGKIYSSLWYSGIRPVLRAARAQVRALASPSQPTGVRRKAP